MSENVAPGKSPVECAENEKDTKEIPELKRDEKIFDSPSRIQENTRGPVLAGDELLSELHDM